MSNPTARVVVCGIALAVVALPAHCQDDAISSAIAYCRAHPNAVTLNDDKSILCFDRQIRLNEDTNPLDDLKPNGMFVIRSPGGYAEPAMRLANILREKNARVVIYDYCFSACANWLLIATNETFVAKNAIIAWHGGPARPNTAFQFYDSITQTHQSAKITCPGADEDASARASDDITVIASKFAASIKPDLKNWIRQRTEEISRSRCRVFEMHRRFFRTRGIDDGYIYEPQTQHTKSWYDAAVKDHGRQMTLWMWNPQHHQGYFKGNIVYEAYPGSQSEVDAILEKLRLPVSIIYDP